MKLSSSSNLQGSNKLNEFIHIPVNSEQTKHTKKPHVTFHYQKSRLETDHTQLSHKRQIYSSSFYDSFQFVDRLTNNKMAYRDVRRGSNSLLQFRKAPLTKDDDKPHTNSMFQIYRKTKNFQMKSLKEKIFKKMQSVKELPQKTQRNIEFNQQTNQRKYQKSTSLISLKPQTAQQFVQRSRQKNKLRSFLDKTVMNMNKAELQRIMSEKVSVRDEVLQFNEDLTKIKCTMDKDRIDDLMYLRQKQEYEIGQSNNFKVKQRPIVFKDLTNFGCQGKQQECTVQTKAVNENLVNKSYGKVKRKKVSLSEQKDNFLQKMLIHTRSQLKKEGEFLVKPNKQTICKSMLMKKSRNKMLQKTMNNDTQQIDLTRYSFERKQQSSLVTEVKSLVLRQSPNQASTSHGQKNVDNQKSIIYLLKNNYISNVGIQLTANSSSCWTKDEKGNNLLHMAIRYQRPEMIEIVLKKFPYMICRSLLMGQNSHKRTPLEMAKLLVDFRAVQVIERFILQNRQKDIVEGWISTSDQV